MTAQNQRMFPIAYLAVQNQMRRSLAGALASDPILPEPRRRTWRRRRCGSPTGLPTARVCPPPAAPRERRSDQLARPGSTIYTNRITASTTTMTSARMASVRVSMVCLRTGSDQRTRR